MQFPGQGKPAVGVIYDSDLGNRIESALALALLYGFDGKNEIRVVAVSTSKENLKSAAFAEIIGRFYAGALSGAPAVFSRTLPVGMSVDGKSKEDTPAIDAVLAKSAYTHTIRHLNDTAEVAPLIRNAFTAQHDQNAIVVLGGPATNLARVLELTGAKEWIERKVKFLAGSSSPISADVPAAKKLFAEWPTPIYLATPEIGEKILFPAASIEKDFAWSQTHPVADAYRAAKPMPYDSTTGDMAAALYAARPKENYFKVSEPGVFSVSEDGRIQFKSSEKGTHYQLQFDPAQAERILKVYTEVASAKPVPRQPRFRPPQEQNKVEEKKETPKPPAEK